MLVTPQAEALSVVKHFHIFANIQSKWWVMEHVHNQYIKIH